MIIEIFISGIPQQKGSHSVGRGGYIFDTNRKISGYLDHAKRAVDKKMREIGFSLEGMPSKCPVTVEVDYFFPRPVSARKRAHHTYKPDLDKLVRTTLDVLTGRAFVDDSQVNALVARKHYTPQDDGYTMVKVIPNSLEI